MPKPMRLPNKFGTISKLSGNRRNPFRARVFEGYTNDGKKIYKNVGYYEKYQDALTALVEYHKNPLDFQPDVTFDELYERWSAVKFEKISQSNINGYKASYKLCESVYKKPLKEIKLAHLQHIVVSTLDVRVFTFRLNEQLYFLQCEIHSCSLFRLEPLYTLHRVTADDAVLKCLVQTRTKFVEV